MTVTFDAPMTNVSFDASRSNGSSPGDGLTVQFWLAGTPLVTNNIVFGDINTWSPVAHLGPVDMLTFHSTGSSFRPYGVDNFRFTIPAPGGAALAGLAFAAMCKRRRR
jgi:hypothetical protein